MAVTTLTLVPLRPPTVDRRTAGLAISLAPVVGVAIGLVMAGSGLAVTAIGAAPLVGAVVTVAIGVAITRALHLDGLADTADGLGSYRDPEAALAIMRRSDIGPFGVVVLVLVVFAQVAAAAVLLGRAQPETSTGILAAAAGIVAAVAGGRAGIALACRRGVLPARPDGLGALVAGTVPLPAAVGGAVAIAAIAVPTVPDRPWQGPLAVVLGLGAGGVVVWHTQRRLGGVTGDVLGAVCELTTTVIYLAASI